jgi:hypothetical protein
MSQKKEDDREQDENDGGDPPDRFDPSWFDLLAKLAPDKFVVIEIVVRQVEAVLGIGVVAPPGIVIGTAIGAGEGAARDIFAADGADLGRIEWHVRGIRRQGAALYKSVVATAISYRRSLKWVLNSLLEADQIAA